MSEAIFSDFSRYLSDDLSRGIGTDLAHAVKQTGDLVLRDWNESFQSILELPESTPEQTNRKYESLAKLSVDFVDVCKVYGKVIISELFLPDELRSIKVKNIGGVAGGQKYIVNGILFKLAQDSEVAPGRFIYGGSRGANEELAAKAAGHDLKGAVQYLNFFFNRDSGGGERRLSKEDPRVTMQALVDYRGFRLMCMPLLPLQHILYGSADGGSTMHKPPEKLEANLRSAGAALNLAPHMCGASHIQTSREYVVEESNEGATEVYTAGDVEGHAATDGRTYLLDFGRALPPTYPFHVPHLPMDSHSVFYRMFRPEYLKIRAEMGLPPLSPDALSGWSRGQPDAKELNQRIIDATSHLLNDLIPEFAAKLNKAKHSRFHINEMLFPVSEKLHRRGINIRHIGLLRSHLDDDDKRCFAK